MQQNYTSREAAALFAGDVDSTTVQRAITRGELAASKSGKHRQSPYRIERAELLRWGADRGFSLVNDAGDRVDVATGEVLDPDAEPTPAEKAAAARARLAGLRVPVAAAGDPELARIVASEPALQEIVAVPAPVASNVARVLLPSPSVAEDRLQLLSKLVSGGHVEAAQLVIEAWQS